MVRGCQKRIYYVKNTGSTMFEEAYFVLKTVDGPPTKTVDETEMSLEVCRLLREMDVRRGSGDRKTLSAGGSKLLLFMGGAGTASAIIGGIALLLVL